jgi:hypothetical protein
VWGEGGRPVSAGHGAFSEKRLADSIFAKSALFAHWRSDGLQRPFVNNYIFCRAGPLGTWPRGSALTGRGEGQPGGVQARDAEVGGRLETRDPNSRACFCGVLGFLETRSHHVAQAGLEHNDSPAPPCPAPRSN